MNAEDSVEKLPRFKFKVQDDVTGVVMAVGTDKIDHFMSTDLTKFLKQFKKNVRVAEKEIGSAAKKGEEV